LEIPNKADSEYDIILDMHHVGIYEEVLCSTMVFRVIIKIMIWGEATVEQNSAKRQKTPEDRESVEDETTMHERVTN
jgi:hypothetical protein